MVDLGRRQWAISPARVENDLLEIAARVGIKYLCIGCDHGPSLGNTLDDSCVQTGLRILNLALDEAFLHKGGESEANDFRAARVMHFHERASRRMRHFKQLLPGF